MFHNYRQRRAIRLLERALRRNQLAEQIASVDEVGWVIFCTMLDEVREG